MGNGARKEVQIEYAKKSNGNGQGIYIAQRSDNRWTNRFVQLYPRGTKNGNECIYKTSIGGSMIVAWDHLHAPNLSPTDEKFYTKSRVYPKSS